MLTPGHDKTLVAAYLDGSRGTMHHAAALGTIMTFTHTASVIVIGLLALFASQFVVPNVLVSILEILSSVLVVFIGARLVRQCWAAFHRHRDKEELERRNRAESRLYSKRFLMLRPYTSHVCCYGGSTRRVGRVRNNGKCPIDRKGNS